jgi:CubicO group peptidase (beta-lactamase class C family)
MTSLGLPRAERPEQVGLSSERLDRITAQLKSDIAAGAIPGAVLAIARSGRIGYAEALGHRDQEAGAAMTFDAIFRIASMTKPIVSVAAMALAEEGRLDAGAPVADYTRPSPR